MLRNNRVIRWRRNAIIFFPLTRRFGHLRDLALRGGAPKVRVALLPNRCDPASVVFVCTKRNVRRSTPAVAVGGAVAIGATHGPNTLCVRNSRESKNRRSRVIVTRRPAFQIVGRNRRAIGHRKNIANLIITITQRHEVAAAGLIRVQRCQTTVLIVVSVVHRRRVAISHTRALAKLVIPHEVQVGIIIAGLNAVDVLNKPARIIIKIKDFAVRVNKRLQPVPGIKRKRGRVHFRRVFRVTFGIRINRARFFNDFTKRTVFAFRQPRFIGDCHNAIGSVKRSPRIAIRVSNIVFAKLRIGDRLKL